MKQPIEVIDNRQGQGKNSLSRADLLWGFSLIDTDQHKQIAEILGFEAKDVVQRQIDQVITPPDTTEKEEIKDDTSLDETEIINDSSKSVSTSSSYYHITGRSVNQTQAGSEMPEIKAPPAWFTEASATILEETTTRIPKVHQVIPLHSELMTWSRLMPFLQRVLGEQVEGVQPDVARLVKQVARGEMIRQIPRKKRHSWATDVRLLIDINDHNFPYRRDYIHLREKLMQIRGNEGLQVQYVYDEPGGYIARYEQQREVIEQWQSPESGTPVLILSDLGMHAKSRKELYAWLVFGQILNAQGFRPVVLMPVAERDIDTRLLKYFVCVVWDRTSRLKRINGDYHAEKDKCNHPESIDQLLSYLFAAVRVDSGLLRAVRHLLSSVYDIGHETALWQQAVVNKEGDEWGWQASGKFRYLENAKLLAKKLSKDKKLQLVELIGRYHALYPDELYFEAMYSLKLLEFSLPDEVQQATEKFMQDVVATYVANPQNSLLHGWVKRHLNRNEAETIRKKHEYWLPFMAFAKLHEEKHGGALESEWPDYLSQEDIEEILRFINYAKAYQTYQLRQVGEKLVLTSEQGSASQVSSQDDWGSKSPAAALLTLNLNDTRIFHIHKDSLGNQRIVSLDLEQASDQSLQFTASGQHEFQIGRERITVEVMAAQRLKEPWMKFISSGSEGLCARSVDQNDQVYDWYWHSPEWQSSTGLLPGFWYGQPVSVVTLKPDWATDAGRDQYGLYADVEIFGITQRFRWIEPTSFLMGSPESEDDRDDDEIQHLVILTQGYWLADTACTQALWKAVMHDNPSRFKGENLPVENVSWNDIQSFIEKLNQHNLELKLRLPTEAEWENACRAGTTEAFNFTGELTLDKVNYRGTWEYKSDEWGEGALQQTADVKTEKYQPTAWGLHQMHGNVWEWCQDWYADYPTESVVDPQGPESGQSNKHRVLRGGSWFDYGRNCRSASRDHLGPSSRLLNFGFRLARGHELSPVRTVKAGQQPAGSRERSGARGGQAGDGLRTPDSTQKPNNSTGKKQKSLLGRAKGLFKK